ncbi:MAG: outer membrane protein assembly factor BamA [Zetaproteobacteria bacterium]|nr:MAG: outer membrane protein assembly factor BamA [Zetaproteobacteria bacterium]
MSGAGVVVRRLLLVLLLLAALPAAAEQVPLVSAIAVEGNRFVDTAAIRDKIKSTVGKPLDRRRISRDVRALYATGLFRDLWVEGVRSAGKVRLIYHVVENPVIGKLTFEGNDDVETKVLKRIVKLKPGHVVGPELLRRERNNLRRQYLKKGHYQVEVSFRQHKNRDGSVDLTVHIDEGPVTRIERIRFTGNHAFDQETLRKQLASRESTFMGWFSDRDLFSRKRTRADVQLLQQYYRNHGYLDAKVESTILALSGDKRSFYVTFNLHEGVRYRVSSITLQGDMVPDRKTLRGLLTLHAGELYSQEKLGKTIEAITQRVGDEGYAFANVTPLFHRDIPARQVAITLEIEKGRKVYVERIEISGNEATDDKVVRRELRQAEGARYSASRVRRSKERLKRLSLFKDVRVRMPRGSAPDKVKMKVDVTEDKTGKFTFGLGFSQLERVFVTTSLQQKNFLGKGIDTKVDATIGTRTQNYDVSITEPYFLDHEVRATFRTFKTQTRLDAVTLYRQNDAGVGVDFGIPITEQTGYTIGYSFSRTNLSNIPTTASIILQAQQGRHTLGELSQSVYYDTRDSVVAPHHGQRASLGVNLAGLGGERRFVEFTAGQRIYFPLGKKLIFSPRLEGRYIRGFGGREVPLERRYSMGGVGSLRGFDIFGVSLRNQGDAVGGNGMVRATADLFFPLPGIRTEGFRGVLFSDAGTVWGSVNSTFNGQTVSVREPFRFSTMRVSAGFGVEWLSPVGPVALVWGRALRKQPGDVTRGFEFALGSTF